MRKTIPASTGFYDRFFAGRVKCVADQNRELWYHAENVLTILGFSSHCQVIQNCLLPEEKKVVSVIVDKVSQNNLYISEIGLYRLILECFTTNGNYIRTAFLEFLKKSSSVEGIKVSDSFTGETYNLESHHERLIPFLFSSADLARKKWSSYSLFPLPPVHPVG